MRYRFGLGEISMRYCEAVEAVRQLALAEGLDTAQRAFADAVADLSRERWVQSTGAKQSQAQVPHWRRLLGERPNYGDSDDWEDHNSLWNREGRPWAYVVQPYWLETDDLRQIVKRCDENELTADVCSTLSWHFPGHTELVVLRRDPNPDEK